MTAIPERTSLTFSDYFKLNSYVDRILAELGYSFRVEEAQFTRAEIDATRTQRLQDTLRENLPYLSLDTEMARREFLIGPVLLEANHYCHARIRSEYFLHCDERLQGTIDYLLEGKSNLLVVEAKNADLTRGFTQLAVEMVAVNQSLPQNRPALFGAVSVGDIWRFARLDCVAKQVVQDLNLFRVPADLSELLRILVGILAA